MADYWLKLYTEILDDPKMALLPHKTWRRVIEMFLISKDTSNDGYLPDIDTIAWRLRISKREMEKDMQSLLETGIIMQQEGRYYIKNFVKRQSPSTNAERQRQFKERKKVTESVEQGNELPDEIPPCFDNEGNEISNEVGNETLPERYQDVTDSVTPALPQRTELRDRVKRTELRVKESIAVSGKNPKPHPPPETKSKPVKRRYGEHKNVLLTEDELRKYQEKYPDDWQRRIDRFSEAMVIKNYNYKSHYHALLKWDRNGWGWDNGKPPEQERETRKWTVL
jgi:hypothetical protein